MLNQDELRRYQRIEDVAWVIAGLDKTSWGDRYCLVDWKIIHRLRSALEEEVEEDVKLQIEYDRGFAAGMAKADADVAKVLFNEG